MMEEQLPSSWKLCKVRDLGDVVSGGTPSTKVLEYWGNDYPWLCPSDLTGFKNKYISHGAKSLSKIGLKHSSAKMMPAGSVHFSSRAPIGYVVISNVCISTNQGFKSLVPAKCLFNEFAYYYFKSIKQNAEAAATGTTFKELSGSAFGALPFPLPPLPEQRRIVAKIEELFSELDAGIENFKRAREQLGIYRQALLKQAFEGKLTEKWRQENPDKPEAADQLLARIRKERETRYQQQLDEWKAASAELEKSGKKDKKPAKPKKLKPVEPLTGSERAELPELPMSWGHIRLGEVIERIDAGKSFSCEERPPTHDEVGVAKVSAVTWWEYDEEESKTCRDTSKVNEDYLIRKGDFLLSRANTIELVGACVIAKRVTKRIMLSDKTLRINFVSIVPEFVLQYLRCRTGRLEIMKRSTGNQESMRNIGQDRIASIIFPLCSPPEQFEIIRMLSEQFEAIEQNEREIDAALERAEALRQSILKKAFSGKLVPQDPNDEPVSELLHRIREERAAAERKGKPKQRRSGKGRGNKSPTSMKH